MLIANGGDVVDVLDQQYNDFTKVFFFYVYSCKLCFFFSGSKNELRKEINDVCLTFEKRFFKTRAMG